MPSFAVFLRDRKGPPVRTRVRLSAASLYIIVPLAYEIVALADELRGDRFPVCHAVISVSSQPERRHALRQAGFKARG